MPIVQNGKTKATETLPKALHRGTLRVGAVELDCYVLPGERRMVASKTAVRAIAGTDSGDLASILPPTISAENGSFETRIERNGRKNKAILIGGKVVFLPPGKGPAVHGITAGICQAYVNALGAGALRTERQKEIAVQCAILLGGLANVGLTALIDEVTGYQRERADDALQVKLAFGQENVQITLPIARA